MEIKNFPELDYILETLFCSSLRAERPRAEMSGGTLALTYDGRRRIVVSRPLITAPPSGGVGLSMVSLPEEYARVTGEGRLPAAGAAESAKPLIYEDNGDIVFSFDILYSAFYILTRMEEIGRAELDKFGRFPASSSHAYKNNYLHRPVVDEYAEILWYCAKKLWPSLARKERKFEMMLTHDVDVPFEALFRPAWMMARSFGADVLRRRDMRRAFSRAANWFRVKRGAWTSDRAYQFDRLMDMGEAHGCRDAFYFIPDNSGSKFNGDYSLDHPAIRALIRHIAERGHEIGYHGSFNTYLDADKTRGETERLKLAAEREGVRQARWGGRQHYLRWAAPQTWRNYEAAGLDYDTTLSFADAAGFRCGTCRPYQPFDAERRARLKLTEYPLAVMECSVLGERYMGYSYEKAEEYILKLKKQCRKYKGTFVALWHNGSFETERDWELYRAVLDG